MKIEISRTVMRTPWKVHKIIKGHYARVPVCDDRINFGEEEGRVEEVVLGDDGMVYIRLGDISETEIDDFKESGWKLEK